MASGFVTFFENIGSWFKKVFKSVPAWNVIALSALNAVAPVFETVFALVDPAAATIVTPIITQIQADLGTVSQLLASGQTVNLATLLIAIKTNFATLLQEAHITDAASVAKANAAETTITSELEALISAIPPTS
jgi:hypothetical protein